ncbi:MAG TPA: Ig-like domain-containing protein, partial [Pyrinomonadaceae bacterium]
MSKLWKSLVAGLLAMNLTLAGQSAFAQQPQQSAQGGPEISKIEITPATPDVQVGQKLKFTAVAKDAGGNTLNVQPTAWVAAPFDLAGADETGTVTFFNPGEVMVGAVYPKNKYSIVKFVVKAAPVARVDVEALATPVLVGGTAKLNATARNPLGDPVADAPLKWTSDNPSIAQVDAAGVITGIAPGTATLRAASGNANGTVTVQIVKSSITGLSIEPRTANARTGDVVRFNAKAQGAGSQSFAVRWTVSGPSATVDPDGGFVAELPGTYVVTAALGDQQSVASVVVAPRNVERELEVVGHVLVKDFKDPKQPVLQSAEEWIFGNYAYVSTISDELVVFDISDPAKPKYTDSLKVDART